MESFQLVSIDVNEDIVAQFQLDRAGLSPLAEEDSRNAFIRVSSDGRNTVCVRSPSWQIDFFSGSTRT